jgi:hypothetical protein
MADALVKDLPRDLPSFLARFGTDAQCRAYLVEARWPDGFRCADCGHDRAWSPAHGFAHVLQNAVRLTPATHRDIVAADAT